MARIPAICRNCGISFASGFELGRGNHASFQSCVAGPCPNCGGNGEIVDGYYTLVQSGLASIIEANVSQTSLDWLFRVLNDAIIKPIQPSALAKMIEEKDQEFGPLSKILRDVRFSTLIAFLSLVLAIYAAIKRDDSAAGKTFTDLQFDELIKQLDKNPSPSSQMSPTAPKKEKMATPKNKSKRTPRKKNRPKFPKQTFRKSRDK